MVPVTYILCLESDACMVATYVRKALLLVDGDKVRIHAENHPGRAGTLRIVQQVLAAPYAPLFRFCFLEISLRTNGASMIVTISLCGL